MLSRALFRGPKPFAPPASAARALSTRVVATIVGPDRSGILTDVSRIIGENDGKIHDTRAQTLGGTFSMMAEVEVPKDSASLGFALNAQLPDFVTALRPEGETDHAKVFGRLDLKRFKALPVLTAVAENMSSRSIHIATMRTSDHSDAGYYSVTATLSSNKEVDYNWLEGEFAELADKLAIDLEFKKLNPDTN